MLDHAVRSFYQMHYLIDDKSDNKILMLQFFPRVVHPLQLSTKQ